MTPPDRSIFDLIYDSSWHHPGLCWAATPLVLGLLWQARPRAGAVPEARTLWWLALLAQLLIVLDALATGGWTPIPADTAASTAAGVVFVILGDLRYFVLLQRYSQPGKPGGTAGTVRNLLYALGLSLLIPVLFELVSVALPTVFAEPRRKFLGYEVLFLGLLLGVRWGLLPRRLAADRDGSVRRWLLQLTTFEMVQYGLWVLADVIILAGARAGLLLRLLPNVLYYVIFVPFAYLTALPSLRQRARAA